MSECKIPPAGWTCSRAPGHEGPCAAWPAHDFEARIRADEREALIAIIERDVSNTHVAAHLIAAIRARKP